MELIRLVAFHKPIVAATRVSQGIETIIKSHLTTSLPSQVRLYGSSMNLDCREFVLISSVQIRYLEFSGLTANGKHAPGT